MKYFTTIFAVMLECSILIYYTNAVMNFKQSRFISNLGICVGYALYAGVCLLQNPMLNIISGIIVMYVTIYVGFINTAGGIALKVIIITLFSMFGEWLSSLLFSADMNDWIYNDIKGIDDIIFTLSSKLILFIAMIILKNISVKRYRAYKLKGIVCFIILPISTLLLLVSLSNIISQITIKYGMLIIVSVSMIIISNYVVYIIYDRFVDYSEEIERVQELNYKEKLDYENYKLVTEKYDELRSMIHDFEKYCNTIECMIDTDRSSVKPIIEQIKERNKGFMLIEYTKSKTLNSILYKKHQQCETMGIDLQLYIQDLEFSFLEELDIVAIFANILDNAIESCKKSENKKIFLSIKLMNNAFVIIRTDNSCDIKPQYHNGDIVTSKSDKDKHGIGLKSIIKSVKKYNGHFEDFYNKENKIFSVVIMIPYHIIGES